MAQGSTTLCRRLAMETPNAREGHQAHRRTGRTLAGGAPSPEPGGLPPSSMNENEKYLIGRPPRAGDGMVNENGQSVRAVEDPNGNIRWRDTQTQQWAKAPKLLKEEVPLNLVGYGPASLGTARRRRSGSASPRTGAPDGLSDVSSVAAASSDVGRSWEEIRTETSFGTFDDEDKSVGAAGEYSPPKQPDSPTPPPGTVQSAGGDGHSSPSFADPEVAAPVPATVLALMMEHSQNALVLGVIKTLLSAEVEESKILKHVAKLTATKPQAPVVGRDPESQEDPKTKI